MKALKEKLPSYLSRKFLLALGGIVFYVLGGVIGYFDWNAVADAVKLIVFGYIGVEGAVDFVRSK